MCENNASKFNLKHRKSFNRFLNHAVDKVPTYTVDVISPYLPCHLFEGTEVKYALSNRNLLLEVTNLGRSL